MQVKRDIPKEIDFKYCISISYYIWRFGLFVVCFFAPFSASFFNLRIRWNDWTAAFVIVAIIIWLLFSDCISGYYSGLITEKSGTVLFDESAMGIAFAKKIIVIKYEEILDVNFSKIDGSIDGWSFLPTGRLTIHLKDETKIIICSSAYEAYQKKKESGYTWKYRRNKDGSAPPVPEILLSKVYAELARHVDKVSLNEIVEDDC